MGAAIESAFYNIPSIGLSNLDDHSDADFTACIEYGIAIAEKVLRKELSGGDELQSYTREMLDEAFMKEERKTE